MRSRASGLTPYAQVGNWPVIILSFLFLVARALAAHRAPSGPELIGL